MLYKLKFMKTETKFVIYVLYENLKNEVQQLYDIAATFKKFKFTKFCEVSESIL